MMRIAPRLALTAILLLGALALASSSSFAAVEKGDWLIRGRGISLNPDDSSGGLKSDLTTGKVGVSADLTPEVDITYMLYKNIGLELIAATSRHNLEGKDGLSNLGVIAEARLLPPTLTLQYHLLPDSPFRPYAGVGINYTHIFNEDATASLEGTLGQTTVDLDDSFSIAFQAGGRPRHHPGLVPQLRPQIHRHQYNGHFEIRRDETEGRRRNRPMDHWDRNRVQILSRDGSARFPSLSRNHPEGAFPPRWVHP